MTAPLEHEIESLIQSFRDMSDEVLVSTYHSTEKSYAALARDLHQETAMVVLAAFREEIKRRALYIERAG